MLSRLADIRPDERRGAIGAFLTLFGVLAGHTLLETARDALFLAKISPTQLPWVYLAIAAGALAVGRMRGRLLKEPLQRHRLSLLLLLSGVVTLVFWFLTASGATWVLYALYVWSGLLATLAVVQFWLLLSRVYTVSQAKRLYGLIGTGAVLGAVAGALLARALTVGLPARHLLLAAMGLLLLSALAPPLLVRASTEHDRVGETPESPSVLGFFQQLKLLRRQVFLSRLTVLLIVSTVVVTLVDYIFKSVVAHEVAREDLGAFFAGVYAVLNLIALFVQVFLVGWLLRVAGVHRALLVLPALLLLGGVAVAAGGGLIAAMLLKGADGSLRHSLNRVGMELLYVPLDDGLKQQAKPVMDVLGQRGGQALASLGILAAVALGMDEIGLSIIAVALGVLWLVSAGAIKDHYLDLFRNTLRRGRIRTRGELPALDLGALETLFEALNSSDDGEVLGALELLEEQRRMRLVPALILYHPSSTVVIRALELLTNAGRTDFLPILDRLAKHADPEVRASAIRARVQVAPEEAALRAARKDDSPLVHTTAIVGLVSSGVYSEEETRHAVEHVMEDVAEGAGVAVVRAIGRQSSPAPVFDAVLEELAANGDPEVRREVAEAVAQLRSERFLSAILPMLGARELRSAARRAFLAIGPPALRFLDQALSNGEVSRQVRRHIPRTVSRFDGEDAADVLLRHLTSETDGMTRYKILRGLGRVAADHPGISLDKAALRTVAAETLTWIFQCVHWRATLEEGAEGVPERATPGFELLVEMLRDKENNAIERLFRLLGLLYRQEDFERIYHGLRNGDRAAHSSSMELLQFVLESPMREAVSQLVDTVPDRQRLANSETFYAPAEADYGAVLKRMLEAASGSVRSLAAYHVGELGMGALRPALESMRPRQAGALRGILERAIELLTRPPEERVAYAG